MYARAGAPRSSARWGTALTFVRIYLIRRGFLDGRHGLVLAVTAASGSFYRYSKLMFLAEKNKQ